MTTQKTPKSPLIVKNEILREEIQQLKDQLKDITAVELKLGELERQIETAKRFIIGKRKQLKKDDKIKATWQNQLLDDFERYVFGYVKKGRKQKHDRF